MTDISSKNKEHNYKERDTLKKKGTKKYQERLVEEREAKEEVKEYEEQKEGNKCW